MYRMSYCSILSVSIAVGDDSISKMLKFYIKILHVMGEALSGELPNTHADLVSSLINGG